MELFPEPVRVEEMDPRRAGGASTRAIYRVSVGHAASVHIVYHDRHGMYCEEHGRECRAVKAVTEATGSRQL